MELEVKLLRARVWLSRRALEAQDGFLAVTRAATRLEKLAWGSLDAPAPRSTRKFESAALKWAASTTTAAALPVAPAERVPPRVEFLLFMLQAAPDRRQQRQQQQRIVFVGRSALRLRAEDLDALRSQHEIVFSTALDGGLGSLDVRVSTRRAAAGDNGGVEPHGSAAAFSVQWSSSDALQRDLADKARLQAESEAKLLLQLRKVLARAMHAVAVRDQALQQRRLWWAAARVQRAFRTLLRRRHELRERERREQLAQQEARKARARAAVVERNLRRAQTMREQLLGRATRSCAPADCAELVQSVRSQAEARERERLRRTRASIDGQHRAAASRATASERTSAPPPSKATGSVPLDAELVRGIRSLYFGSRAAMT